MSDLIKKSAAELAKLIADGEVSSREVTQAHLDQISKTDSIIHAFLHVDGEGALAQADAADKKRTSESSPLNGVPLALKDVLTQKGIPTTCGSKILEIGRAHV